MVACYMTQSMDALKILIVEDQLAARQTLTTSLRTRNVTLIDTAVDGQIGAEMVEQAAQNGTPYDIVFLDWDIPKITGIDLLKRFRSEERFANTAFVMVTAMSMQNNVLDAIKSGATAYMVKPVTHATMIHRFDSIFSWVQHRHAMC